MLGVPTGTLTLVVLITFVFCVQSRFINFHPGYEYEYKFNSKADVKNVGEFHIVAKVSYTNIRDSDDHQEIALRIYALELKNKNFEDVSGHNWDFSKWFSFVITPYGEIVHVYHPVDDDDEAVAIKKGLAAMFASRLHHHSEELTKLTDDGWEYRVKELGQEGHHEASYTVRPTKHGHMFTKVRDPNNHPVKPATSEYTKTLYYNNDLGNIQTVEVNETFEVMHKVPDGFDPYENTRRVKTINEFTEIDTPSMSALGSGKLDFLTRQRADHTLTRPNFNITRASIHIDKVRRKKTAVNVEMELGFIKGNLTCMQREPVKGSKKMSQCFNAMLSSLKELPDDEISILANKYLSKSYGNHRERNDIMDAIAAVGTEQCQKLLFDLVLNCTKPSAFLVKRLLIHLVSIDKLPIDDILNKLQDFVFHPEHLPLELQDDDTHNRMMLTLGVLAKELMNAGRKEEATNIDKKIHNMLGLHDPWLYRQKRSLMTEDEMLDYDHRRVVLLETLGNAALDQSYEYIVSHVNTSNSQWVKRAGIHALRKYRHSEAANIMLSVALTDEDENVRYDAFLQYQAHPKAATVVPMYYQEGSLNASTFMDPRYERISAIEKHGRHKRSIFDNTIVFVLKPPGVDWGKKLGSTKLGASFGLTMQNLLDFNISPKKGHAKVYLYDEAYATVHLGLLGFNLNFFRARLCFKGSASYDLNVLQEFDIDNLKKLVEKYDKIKSDIVDAIETGVGLFRDIIDGEISIGDMVDEFKQALEELPSKVIAAAKTALLAMIDMGDIDETQLPAFISPTRNLILKVSNLYNDIKSTVMTFINTLMETVTIVIPRAVNQIYKGIQTIVDGFEVLNEDPKQAISAIAGQITSIALEVKNLVDAILKAKKACFFLKDQRPYWWNLQGQIDEIKSMATEAVKAFKNGASKWVSDVAKGKVDPIAEFTNGKTSMAEEGQRVLDMLEKVRDDIMAPLEGLKNLGGRFEETFQKVTSVVDSIKEAYDSLKEGYQKARSIIDGIFGPKCHKKFPRSIREAGGGCSGSGFYPSSLKNGQKENTNKGVDLLVVRGTNIVAPFTGTIMLSGKPNEVIIQPKGGSLKKTDVIITYVKPNATIRHPDDENYAETQVKAGQVIGVAVTSACGLSNNHIHLSLRRSSGFVDPTKYLEPRLPGIPKWVQECDDYKLVWKLQTVAAGSIVGKKGKKVPNTSPPRTGKTIKKPQNVQPSKNPSTKLNAANNDPNSMYQKQKKHKTAVDNKVTKTKDKGLKSLMKSPLAFLKKFKIGSLTLGAILDILDILGLDESKEKMADVIKLIKKMIDNKPCFNPHQMTDNQLRTELLERRMKTDGPRETLIKRITTPSNKCGLMLAGMPKNIYCTFDSMCLGVECCTTFKLAFFRKSYKVYARLDPCQFEFVVGVQSLDKKFEKRFGALDGMKSIVAGFDKTLPVGIKLDILGGIELFARVKLEKEEGVSLITFAVGFCSSEDQEKCLGFVKILDDMITPLPICHDDGTMEWPKTDYRSLLNRENIKKKLKEKSAKLVKDGLNLGITKVLSLLPCISKTAPGKTEPCTRPESMTSDLVKNALKERSLSRDGTKAELVQRLKDAHKKCTILGKDYTLPSITNPTVDKIVYMQMSPNCLRLDACLDVQVKTLDFHKAFKAYIELDACRFTLILNFETCKEEIILFGYEWGKPAELLLSNDVIIKYTVDRNEEDKVFIVTMGMMLRIGSADPILDSNFIEKAEVPIPLCNEGFRLPGSGSLKDLAKQMGGKLIGEVVDVFFKMLKLDTVFTEGQCSLPPSPKDCPWQLPDITNYLPSKFKDKVTCSLPENCFGVQCCVDFVFDIPLFNKPLIKSVNFYLLFEPSELRVDVGFGNFVHSQKLLNYNWGNEITIPIPSEDRPPIVISFTMDKYNIGIILDLSVTTCIPVDDTNFCFPEGGLQLMQGQKIPAFDAKALVEFTRQNFSLGSWAKDLGLDLTKGLAKSAAKMLLDKFGISEWLLEERCDIEHPPYSSAINGLKNDCKKSVRLPKFPKGIRCHLAESCTKIDCCFDVAFLDMSFRAVLDVDMCDYNIFAAIEKKTFRMNMLGDSVDLNTGVTGSQNIADVFTIDFGLKKRDKRLVFDLDINVCFMSDDCSVKIPVLSGFEVPQFICDLDARLNFKNINYTEWLMSKGQEVGKQLAKSAVNLLLEQYGLKDFMLNPGCDRGSLRYIPADAHNWKNDCPFIGSFISLPSLKSLPANCYINDKCLGIDCCLDIDIFDLSVHASFTIDLCNFVIEGNIEAFKFHVYIFEYDWGTEEEVTLDGIPAFKINFKIDRIKSQQIFIVDMSLSVCMDSSSCQASLKVMDQTQLPMPGCATIQGFKIPTFDFSQWLKERGDEMTAQLASVLFETLGINKFLLDNQCQSSLEPFKDAKQGWKNDCPETMNLPALPNDLVCYITDYCTGITCCALVPKIKRNFQAHLNVDSCNFFFSVGIEKLEFTYDLFTYKWGTPEVMDIGGVFKVEFTIENLEDQKKFLVNLKLKICLTAGAPCQETLDVFTNMLVPKPFCDWEGTKQLADFSLTDWLSSQGTGSVDRLGDLLVTKLLSFLKLDHFMSDNQCNLDNRGPNGWQNECPLGVTLPDIPNAIACSVPTHCTAINCCVDVPFISRNINFTVDLDMCRMSLHLGIEKLQFKKMLFKYQWGKLDSFSINGVFRASFVIENLSGERQFLVSLNLSACFDPKSECHVTVPVVHEARFPNPVCDWEALAALKSFSLQSTLENLGAVGSTVTDLIRTQIAEAMSISEYLVSPMCNRNEGIYKADATGWNKACPRTITLPNLPSSLSCYIPDYCTGIDCCVTVPKVGMSFNFKILLNACDFTITVGLEKLVFKAVLFQYKWGEWDTFNLNKIFKLDYRIIDLRGERRFLVSAKVSICLETNSPCPEIPLMTDVRFPKPLCNWEDSLADVSLESFLADIGANVGDNLRGVALSKFLSETGITPYLSDPPCSFTSASYIGAIDRWKKDCKANIALPELPNNVVCHLSDPCGTIQCCINVPVLGRTFQVHIGLDPCTFTFTMGIEKLVFSRNLFAYKWGQFQHFNLRNMVAIDFMIDDLFGEKQFLISLNASVCFGKKPCLFDFEVLKDIKIPKLVCDWDSVEALQNFNLDDTLAELQATGLPSLTSAMASEIFRKLEIGKYLRFPACSHSDASFNNAVKGWNNECPISSLTAILPELHSTLRCHVSDLCTSIDCCVYSNFLARGFRFFLTVDMCNFQLRVGIENLIYERMLFSYAWGTPDHFYLNGFIRLDYTISKLHALKKLEVTASISICWTQSTCDYTKSILNKVQVPQPLCDWEGMIALQDFKFSDWSVSKGLSVNPLSLSETFTSQLLNDMDVSQYLLDTPCDQGSDTYTPANIKNWKTECTKFTLPKLHDSMRCHLSDDCSSVDCCVKVPLINRNINIHFGVNICSLQMFFGMEKHSYTLSLLNYKWGSQGQFPLGVMGRLDYKIEHMPEASTLKIDLTVHMCFGDKCFLDIPVFQQAELVYSPCQLSLPVPFKGVTMDVWRTEPCHLPAAPTGCTVSLPAALADVCRLTDNCMGISCCVEADLEYMGVYSLNAGIEADHCAGKLKLHVENKPFTITLTSAIYGVQKTEKVGDAITLKFEIIKTTPSYTITFSIEVCFFNTISNVENCMDFPLLDRVTFPIPGCGSTRRRRSAILLSSTSPNAQLNELLEHGATNEDIGRHFESLAALDEEEASQNLPDPNPDEIVDATNTKTTLKAMGQTNPGTILYSKPLGPGNATMTLEGGEKIMQALGEAKDIAGRMAQTFIVGQGLTGAGLELLGAKLAKMTIGQIIAMFDAKNTDPELSLELAKKFRDLVLALYSEIVNALVNADGEDAFKSFDMTLDGTFSFPRVTVIFFQYQQFFLVGGLIPMTFSFGAGASYGMDITIGAKVLAMQVFGTIRPYASANVYGELGIGAILYGKLRLDGYLMTIAFPSYAEIGFSKFPLDLRLKMDLELTPIELKLSALVTLEISIPLIGTIKKVLFKTALFRYSTPTIRKTMIDVGKKEEDESPPKFLQYVDKTGNSRKRRAAAASECTARQLPDRDYTQPAFEIAVNAEDDVSQVEFSFDTGTNPGLSDLAAGVTLGGPSSIVTKRLSATGVPAYFTVYGQNSGGKRSEVTCSIPTYDVTLPGGRLTAVSSSTSNPAVVKADVVVYEDSEIVGSIVGVGHGKHHYSDQAVPYYRVNLKERETRHYDSSDDPAGYKAEKHFTGLRHGRLIGPVIRTIEDVTHAGLCAKECMKYSGTKCLSINFDYGPSGMCELLEAIEGHDYKISVSGKFAHFERLGVGRAHEFHHEGLSLLHEAIYYFNMHLQNSLGYESVISSEGIQVDLTPPEPGPVANVSLDKLEYTSCKDIIPDDRKDLDVRCIDVNNNIKNHRIIVDGEGSMTVFNGDKPLVDLLYTRANRYVSANWDGIHDKQTHILLYSWTVGREVCEELIHPHHDPHKHLYDETEWTHTGLIAPIPDPHDPLPDGRYYITLRALNKVEYGGPMATTICHTIPYGIDNSPPFVYDVFDVTYQEDTFIIQCKYNASDPESHIREVDQCLGETPRDCLLMDWVRSNHSDSGITRKFKIKGGIPAWVKVRAINHVDLMRVGVADYPIIVDITEPVAGIVYDGSIYKHDLKYTKDAEEFCANWFGFFDPESGISKYELQVQNKTGFNMSEPQTVDHKTHEMCVKMAADRPLEHGEEYMLKLTASNAGHNQLAVTVYSDGVLVDLTVPVEGQVIDGLRDNFTDVEFSTHVATVATQWRDYYDPESDIREYSLLVQRSKNMSTDAGDVEVIKDWVAMDNDTTMAEWHNLHLYHRDIVKTTLRATNNALGSMDTVTSGFVVDLTPPRMKYVNDGGEVGKDSEYQSSTDTVECNFYYYDEESGLDHFKYQVYETYHGSKHQIYPVTTGSWDELRDPTAQTLSQSGLSLKVGALYSLRIGAINKAGSVAIYNTNGVILDNTGPSMKWVYVGIFSGSDEEVFDGYVIQSDPEGIKATWFGNDPESGIEKYKVAVGTTKGGSDVMVWTDFGPERDRYINGLSLSITDSVTKTPVYYVSVKSVNGADLTSDVITSHPIRVVAQDKPGVVIDGANDTELPNHIAIGTDVDYQRDSGTVTVQFEGFESHEHGVTYYDWAVGTTPGGEDMQPFIMAGLIHEETETDVPGNGIASTGFGQAVLPLKPGVTYYTTIRGITNGGNILQSSSDGFTVDKTPPTIDLQSFANEDNKTKLTTDSIFYQSEVDSMSASWKVADSESPIKKMSFSVGTYPYGEDVEAKQTVNLRLSGEGALPSGVDPNTEGKSNYLTLTVENEVGLSSSIVSPRLVVDVTPPTRGTVKCPKYVQSRSSVECSWSGFFELESEIVKFTVAVVTDKVNEYVIPSVDLAGNINRHILQGLTDKVSHDGKYFAKVTAYNTIGDTVTSQSEAITVDNTPPVTGTVVELKSAYIINVTDPTITEKLNTYTCNSAEECLTIDATCQESLTTVLVAWEAFTDTETNIVKYEIAVGYTPGGGQLKPFFEVDDISVRYKSVTGLVLKGQKMIFVSVKATNGAGLSSVSTSNGIYISYLSQGLPPLEHVGVWDGSSLDGDIRFQTSLSSMSARWDVSGDPCPVVKYEWAIHRADGLVVQDFVDTGGRTYGVNDGLQLKNKERLYQVLRVTNAIGYEYTVWSDGITIEEEPLIPGSVYDGDFIGQDLRYHRTKTKLACNWDNFGSDRSSTAGAIESESVVATDSASQSSNQEISYYEVAIGTDRRYAKTRYNVRPFTNVGQSKRHTFIDLELIPITGVYYCTVRAHSTSGSIAEITSNGASVIFDGGVTGGKITMNEFVSDNTTFQVSWGEFESKIGMMMYYVGVSTTMDADQYLCGEFTERGNQTDETKDTVFDIATIDSVGKDTFKKFENLNLSQSGVYYVWVIGVDRASECNMTSKSFKVDVTPPVEGKVKTGPDYDMVFNYASSSTSLEVFWKDFEDEESGIRCYHLTLLRRLSCDEGALEEVVIPTLEIDAEYKQYKFTTQMERNMPYYVRVVAENNAFLRSTVFSPFTLFDDSLPTVGRVSDGDDFIQDVSWIGSSSVVTGTFLYFPGFGKSACPERQVDWDDPGWQIFQSDDNRDSSNRVLGLSYRSLYVQAEKDSLNLKLVKDNKKNSMFSGAYYRDADLVNGGVYKISIKSASGKGDIITSVMFWDGPTDYIMDYDFTPIPGFDETNCDCCTEDPIPASCSFCDCENYYRTKRSADSPVKQSRVETLTPEQIEKVKKGSTVEADKIKAKRKNISNSCGLQIYGGAKAGRIVTWCQFQDILLQPMFQIRDLEIDPSTAFHDFKIEFELRRTESRASKITWCYIVFMDGEMLSELCGVPQLSLDTKLFLHVWNHKNNIPDTEVDEEGHIKVWSTQTAFRNLIMPPGKEKLCRYGVPFQGGNNPLIRFEAAVKSDTEISEFVSVDTPCLPCVQPCDRYSCQADCSTDETRKIDFTLTGLDLNETTVVEGETKAITHVLIVKALLASGTSAQAMSDGFSVDTTPPELDTNILYFDVKKEQQPIKFQSSNNTIMAVWKCKDIQSEIVEYKWSIGTSVGADDVMNITSTGENTGATKTGLTLVHDVTYYVTVTCINGAGLESVHAETEGVTVLLKPPKVENVSANIEGAEELNDVTPPHSMRTYDQTSVGCNWEVSDDPAVRRYDFCVGSCGSSIEDICPCTWVGYNQSGTVYIKDGCILIDDFIVYKLSSFQLGKDKVEGPCDREAFRMAPGTVMCVTMKICNQADTCADKKIGNIVVETPNSRMATSADGSSVKMSVGPPGPSPTRKKRATSDIVVQTPDGMVPGQSIVITELTREDLEKKYQSEASPDFVPYITDPNTTLTDHAFIDRILRRRLNYSQDDMSFSITSVGSVEMPGPLQVSFPYEPEDTVFVFMLLYWDPGQQKWIQGNKTCRFEDSTEVLDPVNSLITVKVCHTRSTNTSDSADTYFSEQTQFMVRRVLIEIPNDPPVLTTTSTLNMTEDTGTLLYEMSAEDPDGDTVEFRQDSSPTTEGDLGITTAGLMIFTPNPDYNGIVEIPVVLYEVGVEEIPPATATVTVTVTIVPENDAPTAFSFNNKERLIQPDPTKPILSLVDQNRVNETDPASYEWVSGAYDVDVPDNHTVYVTQPDNGTITFVESTAAPDCSDPESPIQCANLSLIHEPNSMNWIYRNFKYTPDPGFYGYDEVRVYTQDNSGAYSDVITLRLAVMERPCQNGGNCTSRNETLYNCTDYRRAKGFDQHYTCSCVPGWTGMHCETDIDECISAPCVWPYACYNEINRYYCACPVNNPNCDGLETWMIALIVLAIVLIIVISFLGWYIFMVKRGRLQWKSLFTKVGRGSSAESVSSDGHNSRTAFVNTGFEGDLASLGVEQEAFRPRSATFSGFRAKHHATVGINYPVKSALRTSPDIKDQTSGSHGPYMISNPRLEQLGRSRSPSTHDLTETRSRSITPVETDSPDMERRRFSEPLVKPQKKGKITPSKLTVDLPSDYFH